MSTHFTFFCSRIQLGRGK